MNTQTEHTPGPWDAAISEAWIPGHRDTAWIGLNVHGGPSQPGCADSIIAAVAPVSHITEEDRANARLIAAAPDLLAFAEAWQDWTNNNVNGWNSISLDELASKAIAKAKGGGQ